MLRLDLKGEFTLCPQLMELLGLALSTVSETHWSLYMWSAIPLAEA